MGAKGPKVQVTEYYMSQHFGVCSPVDALLKIIVKEKEAWSGYLSGQQALAIDEDDLFGGVKKEGGVRGTVHFLPGAEDQVLPDVLAQRLGRANGADAPGYRGLASLFFIGSGSHRGFYWTANNPYLPGVWATVRRAPIGLAAAYALVPRPGSDFHPYEIKGDAGTGVGGEFTPDFTRYYQEDSTVLFVWDVETRTKIAEVPLVGGQIAISNDFVYAKSGGPTAADFELWRYNPDGSSATLLVHGFDAYVSQPRCVADQVLFYPGTSNEINIGTFTGAAVAATALDFSATHFFEGPGGAIFAVGVDQFTEDNLHIKQLGTVGPSTVFTTAGGGAVGMWNGTNIVVWQANTLRLIDPATFTQLATDTLSVSIIYAGIAFNAVQPGTPTMWVGFAQFSTLTLATLRTVNPNDWISQGSLTSGVYDPVNNALMDHEFGTSEITWRFLDRGDLDANPAHIIYEALTNTDWGMGSPESLIDKAGFEAIAIVLYNEPLGLSMIWTRQSSIQDFIQEVLDHIQGALFVDPQTGLLTLKLIRGDYDVGALPTIDPSNATLTNFGRKLWGDIVNEISVTWTNPDNEQDETVTVHDLASIATQGGIISDSRNYYGVRYPALAQRLAARDLRSAGAPLAACDAEIDRTMWFLRPASVLLLDWPEYGLVGLVMRVTAIDYGKPGDMTLKVSLIEDVFGLDAGDYVDPPSTSWEDTSSPPSAMSEQEALTLPYYMAKNAVTSIEGAAYPEVIAGVLGASANADVYGFELWGEVSLPDGSTEWQSLASLNILGRAQLAAGLTAEAASTGVTFSSFIGSKSPQQAGFAIIGAAGEDGNELALITAAASTYSLSRGVLDTVPRAWASGTPVWFIDSDALFEDTTARSVGEVVEYRLRTRTSQGMLDLFLAPLLTATMTDRPWQPSRPAKVTIGGVQFNTVASPVDMTGRTDPWVTVTWAARNRLSEDTILLNWTDATVTPETGQTTTVTVYAADGTTVLATHAGLAGTSYNVPNADFGTEHVVLIVPTSSRTDADGTFESLQGHGVWVRVSLASGAEGVSGAGAASFAGAQIRGASFSGSGSAVAAPTGTGTTGSSISASGSAATAIVGAKVASAALSSSGAGSIAAVSPTGDPIGTQIFLTATGAGTWTVPSDWHSVQVELIGAGGHGRISAGSISGGGGGGGQYAKLATLSVSGSVNYQVGAQVVAGPTGQGTSASPGYGDTWFSASTTAYAQAGTYDILGNTGGAGGAATAVGSCTVNNGGNGGGGTGSNWGGGGGGGAGGPNGAGKNGAAGHTSSGGGGGGGGGANNGSAGTASTSANGGAGGNNRGGTGGGTGGVGATGGNGTAGGGGGGGSGGNFVGGNGSLDPVWDATHGPGGGGGGAGGAATLGGSGAGYGSGGGGGSFSGGAGGPGTDGIIVLTKLS